ncbi:hypothetical protein B2M23_20790 [Eubacterium limosum]|uniref:Uncharacterized protein n=2 Tax=Eubacterium limosum TaxID=1736 RepID=A0AAC9W4M8_EUBLI|nr:hypothetical protein B2M23_20790 [Eubacterium limosum]
MGQTGLQQVLLTDESDKLIAGYGMYKSDKVGNTAHVITWVPDGEFKDILFTPSVYVENPFRVNHGECDLLKEGSKLRFHYYGSYYSINVPEIENKKVTYIYVVLGDWGDSEKYMSIIRWVIFMLIKIMSRPIKIYQTGILRQRGGG